MLAKNEIAKKYGVKTAEAIWEAKLKCEDLVILPPDYKKYNEYSLAARAIYERYTDLVEPFGIDECWLDVTGSTMLFGSGEKIAEEIRKTIKRELGITISVGVSFNKVFAKLGSDLKKPNAVTVISRENFKEKIWKLSVAELLFVGKSTAEKLNSNGVFTIGDLASCDNAMLTRLLGKNGSMLQKYALGLDDAPVVPQSEESLPKSVGRSVTLGEDIKSREEVWRIFLSLSDEISQTLRAKGLYAAGVQVHTRDSALTIKEFSHALSHPLNSAMLLARQGIELFDKNYMWALPLRSVGIRAINLKTDNIAVQQDVFGESESEKNTERIDDSIAEISKKFGKGSIKRGRTI